jgi:hypothetical protein
VLPTVSLSDRRWLDDGGEKEMYAVLLITPKAISTHLSNSSSSSPWAYTSAEDHPTIPPPTATSYAPSTT